MDQQPMTLQETVARALNGPHQVDTTSRWSLDELRNLCWHQLTRREQVLRLGEARVAISTIFRVSNERQIDDGLRTVIDGALEIVRKRDPGMVGLIHNLKRLSDTLQAMAAAQVVLAEGRKRSSGDVVEDLACYQSGCRDCADEDGVCPHDGIACGGRRKVAELMVEALRYYGWLPPPSDTEKAAEAEAPAALESE